MVPKQSSPHVSASNSSSTSIPEASFDEDLVRGFTLDQGASGRKEQTLSGRSVNLRSLPETGTAPLAETDKTAARHWVTDFHRQGTQARWCVGALSGRQPVLQVACRKGGAG